MKHSLLALIATITFSIGPILSHGNSGNCLDECNDYYCPSEHQLDKKEKEKVKNNVPSKK